MYWDIHEILKYQRNFNFINAVRSVGKTYGTEKFIVNKSIELPDREFMYIVRTKEEIRKDYFEKAFKKVLQKEFPNQSIKTNKEEMVLSGKVLGYCVALSDVINLKKKSFPNLKYMMFDEYMLEQRDVAKYVSGWSEPDLLLNLYHTVDREEDRVIVFCLGNNTNFHNPYHLHPAFNIPMIEDGEIWYNENVLFQRAVKSNELKEAKSKSKFLKMIEGTKYANYAEKGEYLDSFVPHIEKRPSSSKFMYVITDDKKYGVWFANHSRKIYISNTFDPSCKTCFALNKNQLNESNIIVDKNHTLIKWLIDNYKNSNVYFETPEIKMRVEKVIFNYC